MLYHLQYVSFYSLTRCQLHKHTWLFAIVSHRLLHKHNFFILESKPYLQGIFDVNKPTVKAVMESNGNQPVCQCTPVCFGFQKLCADLPSTFPFSKNGSYTQTIILLATLDHWSAAIVNCSIQALPWGKFDGMFNHLTVNKCDRRTDRMTTSYTLAHHRLITQ